MMNIIGLVSIPGMMTGQILGGTSPEQSARYQIMIVFMIGCSSAVSTTISVVAAVARVCDANHRLRHERLVKRDKSAGIVVTVKRWWAAAWGRVKRTAAECGRSRRRSPGAGRGTYAGLDGDGEVDEQQPLRAS